MFDDPLDRAATQVCWAHVAFASGYQFERLRSWLRAQWNRRLLVSRFEQCLDQELRHMDRRVVDCWSRIAVARAVELPGADPIATARFATAAESFRSEYDRILNCIEEGHFDLDVAAGRPSLAIDEEDRLPGNSLPEIEWHAFPDTARELFSGDEHMTAWWRLGSVMGTPGNFIYVRESPVTLPDTPGQWTYFTESDETFLNALSAIPTPDGTGLLEEIHPRGRQSNRHWRMRLICDTRGNYVQARVMDRWETGDYTLVSLYEAEAPPWIGLGPTELRLFDEIVPTSAFRTKEAVLSLLFVLADHLLNQGDRFMTVHQCAQRLGTAATNIRVHIKRLRDELAPFVQEWPYFGKGSDPAVQCIQSGPNRGEGYRLNLPATLVQVTGRPEWLDRPGHRTTQSPPAG